MRQRCEPELEGALRYQAARRLIDAVLAGEWEATNDVLAAIETLVALAGRFYDVASWRNAA